MYSFLIRFLVLVIRRIDLLSTFFSPLSRRENCNLMKIILLQESISPTFYWRNCANILAQIKSLTFTASTKKLRAKLSYEKGARKMLVKLTPTCNLRKFVRGKSSEKSKRKEWLVTQSLFSNSLVVTQNVDQDFFVHPSQIL